MSVASSPAVLRLSESAGRILEHLGARLLFRQVTATPDLLKGSEAWEPSESTITARASRFWATRKREGGESERYERIEIEARPFDEAGGLSDEWEVELQEGWTPLEKVLLSDDETTFEADLCPVRTS